MIPTDADFAFEPSKPDWSAWWQRAAKTLEAIRDASNVETFEYDIAPALGNYASEKTSGMPPREIPKEMVDFYSEVSSGIRIRMERKLTRDEYALLEQFEITYRLKLSFSVFSPPSLLEEWKDYPEVLDTLIGDYPNLDDLDLSGSALAAMVDRIRAFRDFGTPIWSGGSGDWVVMVKPNTILEAGIYSFSVEESLAGQPGVRYASDFTDWLEILESACFINPHWTLFSRWSDGRRVQVPFGLKDRLQEILAIRI